MDIGAQLRAAREAHGLSLARLSQKIRVQARFLAAIEENDVHAIPPKPFGRGFVRAYALEVGLNPDQTVTDYFRQFTPAVPVAAPAPVVIRTEPALPAWLVPTACAVALLAAAAYLLPGIGSRSVEDAGGAPAAPVGTSGDISSPRAMPLRPAPAADATPAVASSTLPAEVTVVIRTERVCWITVVADGKRTHYELVPAGSQRTIRATREIVLLAGDAGAVRLTINGREAGTLGEQGEVKRLRLTPATASKAAAFASSARSSR